MSGFGEFGVSQERREELEEINEQLSIHAPTLDAHQEHQTKDNAQQIETIQGTEKEELKKFNILRLLAAEE